MNALKVTFKFIFGLCLLTTNSIVIAKSAQQTLVPISFETIDSPKCENGFTDPKQKMGYLTVQLKKQVKFNDKKNWMHTFQYCTFAKYADQQYIIRNYFILDSKSAFYVIFDHQDAFAIYGDYAENGKWFYRDGKVGQNAEKLKKILEQFLIQEEWLEQK